MAVRKRYSLGCIFFNLPLRGQGEWDSWAYAYAAENGHLHVLKWARENGCEWDSWAYAHAAENGHLHVLKWVRENGEEKIQS